MANTLFTVGDKVTFRKNFKPETGQILFMGDVKRKNRVSEMVGILADSKQIGLNVGPTIDGIKYFDGEKNRCVFIKRSQIEHLNTAAANVPRIGIGTNVKVKSLQLTGSVKFIGTIFESDFDKDLLSKIENFDKNGVFYGIDLSKPNGYFNGITKNRTYFRTQKNGNYGILATCNDIVAIHASSKNNFDIFNYETEKLEKEKELLKYGDNGKNTKILRFPYVSSNSLTVWRRELVVKILSKYLSDIDDLARLLCSFIPHTNKIVYGSDDDRHLYDVKQKIALFSASKNSNQTAHNISIQFGNNDDISVKRGKGKKYSNTSIIDNYMCYLTINGVTAFIMLRVFPYGNFVSTLGAGLAPNEIATCHAFMFICNLKVDSHLGTLKRQLLYCCNQCKNKNKALYLVLTNTKDFYKKEKAKMLKDDNDEKEEMDKVIPIQKGLEEYATKECKWKGLVEHWKIEDEDDINEIDDMMMMISLFQIKKVQTMMLDNDQSRAFVESLKTKKSNK